MLVVDDESPDGTGRIADELARADPQVHVLHRAAKGGLGAAYLHGFAWALDEGYDVIGEMDADGSHQPEQLHRLLTALDDADLVIGSRWVPGGSVVNWPRRRELLSRGGNLYVRLLLGIVGARRDRRLPAVPAPDPGEDRPGEGESTGYVFQTDLVARTLNAGLTVREVPIEFVERVRGDSKMSGVRGHRVAQADHRLGPAGAARPGPTRVATAEGLTMARRRRGGLGWLLFIAFIVVPIVEIYVLIQVGQVIGPVVDDPAADRRQHPRQLADQARGRARLASAALGTRQRADAGQGAGRRRADPDRRHADAHARASSPTPSASC